MADHARSLISKIVLEGDLATATLAGARASWFDDEEHREAFSWILEYHGRYGEAPTKAALKTQFPNYRLTLPEEPYAYYLDCLRDQHRRSVLLDAVIAANGALEDGDSRGAQEAMSAGLLQVGKEVSSLTDESVLDGLEARFAAYQEARANVGVLRGVATGFEALDFLTGGFHPQQFILIGGAAKQGKSFMMMKSAMAAQAAGKKVLFLSFEMSQHEQRARYDAMACGINSMRLLHGNLTDEDERRLQRGWRLVKNLPPLVISADISATTTVSGLSAKIDEHQPDIVFVDGVYLMENEVGADPGSPQAYTAVSRGLKRLAQRIELPLVGSTQALSSKMGKDGAVTLHSLGWTSAWSQDADLILGAEREPGAPIIRLRVVAGRQVSPTEITVAVNWEESRFEEVELGESEDYE